MKCKLLLMAMAINPTQLPESYKPKTLQKTVLLKLQNHFDKIKITKFLN